MQDSEFLGREKEKMSRITFRKPMKMRMGVDSAIFPSPSSKLNHGGGRERRRQFDENLILWGVFDVCLE